MRIIMYKEDKIVKVINGIKPDELAKAVVEAVEMLGVDRVVVVGGDG